MPSLFPHVSGSSFWRFRRALGLAGLLILTGCSGNPSLQDVIIADLGEPGWEVVADGNIDADTVGFFQSFADPSDAANIGNVEGFWLRVWESNEGMVFIIAGDPGPVRDGPEVHAAFEEMGMERTAGFGTDGIVVQTETSDDLGSSLDVMLAKEGHIAFVSFIDSYPDAFVADTVARQLAAIPEYDPEEPYRGVMIVIVSTAFLIALGFAVRSSNRVKPSTEPEENNTP